MLLAFLLLLMNNPSMAIAGSDAWTTHGPTVGQCTTSGWTHSIRARLYDHLKPVCSLQERGQWSTLEPLDTGFSSEDPIHSVAIDSQTPSTLYAVGFNTIYKGSNAGGGLAARLLVARGNGRHVWRKTEHRGQRKRSRHRAGGR